MAKKSSTDTAPELNPLVSLEFNGHTFTFARDQEDWPTRAIIAASRRQYDAVVEHVLGPGQWESLMSIAAPTYRQFMEFLTVFADTVERECG